MPNSSSRRLAVILHADVINSTALVHRDESVAHDRIQDAFRRFSETIQSYGGVTLELRGDALLAEFGRASDAVSAALSFQRTNRAYNDTVGGQIQAQLRVGLSLGEVIIADSTVTGVGVVLAQRLEQLAVADGVVIQGAVREAVPTRLPFSYENLGEQMLKGFERPIGAFAVSLEPGGSIPGPETAPDTEPRHAASSAPDVVVLPDTPSIAVLPFENLSNDPEQGYFADGVAGDIIIALGRIRQFFVIARNTTFSYKGQTADARTVARELGVRYVLTGTVRKAGNRIRVSAQLVEGATGNPLWAERYDRELVDVFDVQDEITGHVVGAIEPELTRAEWERAKAKKPENLDAWDCVVHAIALMMELSDQASAKASDLLDQAVALDPTYARAYGHKAWLAIWRSFQGWSPIDQAVASAVEDSARGLQLDANEPWCYIGRAFVGFATRDAELALSSTQKAIQLSPSFAFGHSILGFALAMAGRGEEGLKEIELAMRLSPRDVRQESQFQLHYAFAQFQAENYQEAARAAERATLARPTHVPPQWFLMASYGHLGLKDKAQQAQDRLKNHVPGFLPAAEAVPNIYALDADHERVLDGLRKAGVLDA
jgi:TolB-like protein/class 3 adenylate cyclase/Tfp pilus assembly protein PilF